jgi:hypothetical protein
MRRLGVSKYDVASVLLVELIPALLNALTAALPETTGSFIRR